MVSQSSIHLAEWVVLISVGACWMLWSFINKAARIQKSDTYKEVREKHKRTRSATALGVFGFGAILFSFGLIAIWTTEADGSKTDDGTTINVQYFRWIGFTAFYLFSAYMYTEYAAQHFEDRVIVLITVFFAGSIGVLSEFAINTSELQIAGLTMTGILMAAAALNAFRYTNIGVVGMGLNYFIFGFVFLSMPFLYYLMLILGPEETKTISRLNISIGYLVLEAFHVSVPPLLVAISFLGTKRLSVDALTYLTIGKRRIGPQDLTGSKESHIDNFTNLENLLKQL